MASTIKVQDRERIIREMDALKKEQRKEDPLELTWFQELGFCLTATLIANPAIFEDFKYFEEDGGGELGTLQELLTEAHIEQWGSGYTQSQWSSFVYSVMDWFHDAFPEFQIMFPEAEEVDRDNVFFFVSGAVAANQLAFFSAGDDLVTKYAHKLLNMHKPPFRLLELRREKRKRTE